MTVNMNPRSGWARRLAAPLRAQRAIPQLLLVFVCAAASCTDGVALLRHAAADDEQPIDARPVLVLDGRGEWEDAPHGEGNVYAPEVHVEAGQYRMWYGAQGSDGHDRICYAESNNGVDWERKGVAVEDATANHVNDPSIVRVGPTYFMYFTRAAQGIVDEIALATSDDGRKWEIAGVVLRAGEAGEWDALSVGRPAVLHEKGLFRMWYDGRKDLPASAPAGDAPTAPGSTRSVGYATSKDGRHWVKHLQNPVFHHGAGGIDVKRVGDAYALAYESHGGTCLATSADGIDWRDQGLWVHRSGQALDAFGHVTPFLLTGRDGAIEAIYFGAARAPSWDRNAIAVHRFDPSSERHQILCIIP